MEICLILHYQGLSQFKPISTPICANYLDSSHVECSLMKVWFKWNSKEFKIIILSCILEINKQRWKYYLLQHLTIVKKVAITSGCFISTHNSSTCIYTANILTSSSSSQKPQLHHQSGWNNWAQIDNLFLTLRSFLKQNGWNVCL